MTDTIVLSPRYGSHPRDGGLVNVLPLAERTATETLRFIMANGVREWYFETFVTVRAGTPSVQPIIKVELPSGALQSVGSGVAMNALGSKVTGMGLPGDTAIDKRIQRLVLADIVYNFQVVHADAQPMTYAIWFWVF